MRDSFVAFFSRELTKTREMKPSAPDFSCPVWAVLPPLLVERIERHYDLLYGEGFTGSNALAKFCSEFIADVAFRERIPDEGERTPTSSVRQSRSELGALAHRSRGMRRNRFFPRLGTRRLAQ
jgi:hypothetical protein